MSNANCVTRASREPRKDPEEEPQLPWPGSEVLVFRLADRTSVGRTRHPAAVGCRSLQRSDRRAPGSLVDQLGQRLGGRSGVALKTTSPLARRVGAVLPILRNAGNGGVAATLGEVCPQIAAVVEPPNLSNIHLRYL